jgi:hypothetical protein
MCEAEGLWEVMMKLWIPSVCSCSCSEPEKVAGVEHCMLLEMLDVFRGLNFPFISVDGCLFCDVSILRCMDNSTWMFL